MNMQDSSGVKNMSQVTIKVIKGKNNTKSLHVSQQIKECKNFGKEQISAKKDMHVRKDLPKSK